MSDNTSIPATDDKANASFSSRVITVTATDGKTGKEISLKYTGVETIGRGKQGTVFKVKMLERDGVQVGGGELHVAIKKVLIDKRFKNRELEIMKRISHPNIIGMDSYFYAAGRQQRDEIYLHLVLQEYLPDDLYRVCRQYLREERTMLMLQIKLYMYQVFRALAYLHNHAICHGNINLQNILLNNETDGIKLCDFGSASIIPGSAGDQMVGLLSYRAPELILGTSTTTTGVGCVMAEIMTGQPLFIGESNIGQLVEIMKVLGVPTADQLKAMHVERTGILSFPDTKQSSLAERLPSANADVLDLVGSLLVYAPTERLSAHGALVHPVFDELRLEGAKGPNGRGFDALFDFSREARPDLIHRLVPPHARPALAARGIDVENFIPVDLTELRMKSNAADPADSNPIDSSQQSVSTAK